MFSFIILLRLADNIITEIMIKAIAILGAKIIALLNRCIRSIEDDITRKCLNAIL